MGAVALAAIALAVPSTEPRVSVGHGLSVATPVGWIVSTKRMTPCLSPVERFHARGDGWWIMVMESVGAPPRVLERFPRRPRHFRLRGAPSSLGCCQASHRPGWWLHFRDGGRAFYAAVYAGPSSARATALAVFDSLRVAPRS